MLLDGPSAVRRFKAAMDTFAEATGQRLHPIKTKLLPVGMCDMDQLPAEVEDFRVVGEATALGITFKAGVGAPCLDWEGRLAGVQKAFDKAAGLGLSAMGRGLAGAAYGVSKLLYHAEFVDLPPSSVTSQLARATRILVLGKPGDKHRLFCVPTAMLSQSPGRGGWGALPWLEHIRARHACWAGRLLAPSGTQQPWVALARGLLASAAGSPLEADIPPPLRRILSALQALPCAAAAQDPAAMDAATRSLVHAMPVAWLTGRRWPELQHLACSTLGGLSIMKAALEQRESVDPQLQQQLALCRSIAASAAGGASQSLAAVTQAVAALPPEWATAGMACCAAPAPLQPPAWVDIMQSTAAWRLPSRQGRGKLLQPWQLSVKSATSIQLSVAEHARDAIFDSAASIIGCGKTDIIAAFTRIWALSWDNVYKEVFWALIYDAYPTAERLGQQWTCGCGAATPGRLHHFWECPVACNMVLEIQRHLPHSTPQLQIVHIWLGQSPGEIALDAWLVVALAALGAMRSAQRYMSRLSLSNASGDNASNDVTRASRHAIARFWALLSDYCVLGQMDPPSSANVLMPFFRWIPSPDGARGQWAVRRLP